MAKHLRATQARDHKRDATRALAGPRRAASARMVRIYACSATLRCSTSAATLRDGRGPPGNTA